MQQLVLSSDSSKATSTQSIDQSGRVAEGTSKFRSKSSGSDIPQNETIINGNLADLNAAVTEDDSQNDGNAEHSSTNTQSSPKIETKVDARLSKPNNEAVPLKLTSHMAANQKMFSGKNTFEGSGFTGYDSLKYQQRLREDPEQIYNDDIAKELAANHIEYGQNPTGVATLMTFFRVQFKKIANENTYTGYALNQTNHRQLMWLGKCLDQIDDCLSTRIVSMIRRNQGLREQGKPYHDLDSQIKLVKREYMIEMDNTSVLDDSNRASQRYEAPQQFVRTQQRSVFYPSYQADQFSYERVAEIVDGRIRNMKQEMISTVTQELQHSLSTMIKSLHIQPQSSSTAPRTKDVGPEQPPTSAKIVTKGKDTPSPCTSKSTVAEKKTSPKGFQMGAVPSKNSVRANKAKPIDQLDFGFMAKEMIRLFDEKKLHSSLIDADKHAIRNSAYASKGLSAMDPDSIECRVTKRETILHYMVAVHGWSKSL